MEPLLRDPVWQFVGVLVTVIAIVITLILFRKQQKKKALEYRVLTSAPIFRNPVGSDKFELLFEKKPIESVQLIIVRIVNTGNVEINPNDYHDHIAVEFSPGSSILSAEITQTSPAELTSAARISANRVVFPPVLLNPEDWFTVQCLIASFKEGIKVSGRISGVKQIREHIRHPQSSIVMRLAIAGFLVFVVVGGYLAVRITSNWPFWTAVICWVVWNAAISAYSTFQDARERKLFG